MEDRQMIRVSGLCGILGVLLYLGVALSDQFFFPETRTAREFLSMVGTQRYANINMAMHFLFMAATMLWITAFLGLNRLLGSEHQSLTLRLGTLFGIVACAIMGQMMIVQGSVMVDSGRIMLSATDEAQRANAVALYRATRSIDYGMDLAFDSFFFTAWILLGYNMLRHKKFGKIFGGIGIILFSIAAILNLRSAPDPPGFDVGPIAVFWLLAVFVQMVRVGKSYSTLDVN